MDRLLSKEIPESGKASMMESVESRASSLIFSETFSDDRIEDMSDEALQNLTDRLRKSANLIRIENSLFERFVSRVDPSILLYVNQALSQHTTHLHSSPTTQSNTSIVGRRNSIDSVTSARTSISKQWHTSSNATRNYTERMPKISQWSMDLPGRKTNNADLDISVNKVTINREKHKGFDLQKELHDDDCLSRRGLSIQQKMDIVARETEILTTTIEEYTQKWKGSKANIVAAAEEATSRLNMIKEASEKLEKGFSSEWLDPITGRVPAERFIRFLKEQIHIAEGTLDRCRLKSSTLRVHHSHAKEQLHYKEELGEMLCPIDFEQLKIDNAQLKEMLQKKNQYLLDLKKISGKCGPTMVEKKKSLWKQMQELKTLKQSITTSEASQIQMEYDANEINNEITAALVKLNALKKLISGYHAPDVMDYIKKKAQLDELERWKRLWSHRRNILNITINK